MKYECKRADNALLEAIWAKNINDNPDDKRWIRWRDEYISYNNSGKAVTYIVTADGEPVGEGTLIISPECSAIKGKTQLADGGKLGNVNALRIEKAHEGQGHISKLVKLLEEHARSIGMTALTIGVEAAEARNLAIYLHWGYTNFVYSEVDCGELVLYYRKDLV
ncbi:MAG: GNAT family N-acetyltransferase [Clostridiales bacterium]|nr:GNAT family N-acetyltransferase [Clostridiales bacterium]